MRRIALVLVSLAAVLVVVTGCGPEKHSAYKEATTEGPYLEAGGLKYQIQISRELNPALDEDKAYVHDLGPGVVPPAAGHEWFAVFMRVENDSKQAALMASDFDIKDTLGNVYRPVAVKPANILSYQPKTLQPKDIYPNSQSAIGQSGPRRGAVILFQINTSAYQNRPLEMTIHAPDGDQARVSIDL